MELRLGGDDGSGGGGVGGWGCDDDAAVRVEKVSAA